MTDAGNWHSRHKVDAVFYLPTHTEDNLAYLLQTSELLGLSAAGASESARDDDNRLVGIVQKG